MLTRREWLVRAGLGAVGLTALPKLLEGSNLSAAPIPITVYKSASCGCCKSWVAYMNANGFAANAIDLSDDALDAKKAALGVPDGVRSCHTAVVGKYLVEGHVPADLVRRLLREHPAALGLAVPGMVVGSPGMEGGTPQHYDIVLFQRNGASRTYASR
ncbi:MAG: DUF411 domain-containing protein [Gemmatimonadales bacterium]